MSSTLLISLFVLLPLAIIIMVILVNSKKRVKRKKNEMLDAYRKIVAESQLSITDEQVLYNKIMAIDPQKKVFIFLRNHDNPVYDVVYLDRLSGCQVERKGTTLNSRRNGKLVPELHVNEIYMSLLLHDATVMNLQVYSEILDGQQEYVTLTKLAEDWGRKLSNIIKT